MRKQDFITIEQKELVQNTAKESILYADEFEAERGNYENYKLEWMIENGYTLSDFLHSVVSYAVDTNQEDILLNDPDVLINDWEPERGFGDDVYEDYESWLESRFLFDISEEECIERMLGW